SYVLGSADVGATVRVMVTASNKNGSASAASAASAVVAAAPSPAPTVVAPSVVSAPVVSGSAQQGQTLSASSGSWDGTQPITYTYQWYRCDSGGNNCVASVTGSTDLLGSADVGATVRVVVAASNSAGSATSTSVATAVVAASSVAPSLVSASVVSGSAQEAQTWSASSGSWKGTEPLA